MKRVTLKTKNIRGRRRSFREIVEQYHCSNKRPLSTISIVRAIDRSTIDRSLNRCNGKKKSVHVYKYIYINTYIHIFIYIHIYSLHNAHVVKVKRFSYKNKGTKSKANRKYISITIILYIININNNNNNNSNKKRIRSSIKETAVAVEKGTYIQIYIYRRTVSRCLSRLQTSSCSPTCTIYSFSLFLSLTRIHFHAHSYVHVSLNRLSFFHSIRVITSVTRP